MSAKPIQQSFAVAVAAFMGLVYSLTVRELRTEHKNAALGILISVSQPLLAGLVYYIFMQLLGSSAAPIRGDDLTFVLVGFFMFFFHIRTVAMVTGAIKRDMLNHQHATPFLFVCVKSLASLYKHLLALVILIGINYLLRDQYEMQDPLIFGIVLLMCWVGGIAVGMICMALVRYLSWGALIQSTYVRVMFFTSGKFFIANLLPAQIRPIMDWNPLFHLLDQGRSAVFINYTGRTTNLEYPILIYSLLLVIGFLVENFVRRNYSASHAPG